MRKLCRVRSLNLVWYACGAQPTYPSLEALREDHPFFAHPPFHSQESVEQCLVSLIEEWKHTSPPVHDISMGDALPRLAFGHGPADQRTFCAELGAEIISAANKVIAIKKGTAPSGASMSLDVASWNLSSLTQWETPEYCLQGVQYCLSPKKRPGLSARNKLGSKRPCHRRLLPSRGQLLLPHPRLMLAVRGSPFSSRPPSSFWNREKFFLDTLLQPPSRVLEIKCDLVCVYMHPDALEEVGKLPPLLSGSQNRRPRNFHLWRFQQDRPEVQRYLGTHPRHWAAQASHGGLSNVSLRGEGIGVRCHSTQ